MQVVQQAKSRSSSDVPIRVLHLGYGARGGGVGRVVSDVACGMQRRGLQCSVVFWGVFPAFSGYMDPLKAAGVPCHDIVKTSGLDLRGLWAIASILRHERPDVIICHGVATGAYRPFLWFATGSRAKWILVDHASHRCATSTLRNNIRYACGAAFADRISFVSPDNFQAAQSSCTAVQGKRCVVICNGIQVPKLPAGSPRSDGVANLTMVGQFSENKDQATLLHAFALVRKRAKARLWFVGDGVETALSDLACDLAVEGEVSFWGFQDGEAVQDLLRKTTVYCFSSRSEGFSLAVLEAMAAGLPVVACNVEGVRNLITDGVTGLLARPGDPEDLARMILRCLEDPALRAKLGQAARARAIAEFSIEGCVKAYGDLVRETVAVRCSRDSEREVSCHSG
jgi:glycosyltransferase involved in cell wall biosynthesis